MSYLQTKPILSKSGWEQRLKGWLIVDCSIRDQDILYVLARQEIENEKASLMWDHDIPTRLVAIYLDEKDPQKNHGASQIEGFNKPRCGVSRKPLTQGLVAARNADGQIYAVGGGVPSGMELLAKGKHPGVKRIKCIDGYAYAVCQGRRIYKRSQPDQWILLEAGIKKYMKSDDKEGFMDLDGVDEKNLYAVGGHGDVWHFDGKVWTQCAFPSKEQLSTVTCSPDGKVYVGGEGGNIWVGLNDVWKKVHDGSSSVLYRDSAWYLNMLWVCSDYGLRVYSNGVLHRPSQNGEEIFIGGAMDCYGGYLFVASGSEAWLNNGKKWQSIVKSF